MKPLSSPYFVTTKDGQEKFPGKELPYFFDQTTRLLAARFCVHGYYSRAFRKPADINDGWMKYVRAIQRRLLDAGSSTTQPLSSDVSHGKRLHNTNSPSASPVTVARIIRVRVHVLRVSADTI